VPRELRWNGHVRIGLGWVMYVGPLFNTPIHVHHAIQFYISLDRAFELRRSEEDGWHHHEAVVVRGGQPHALRADGALAVMLLLEPESEGGRSVLTRHRGSPFSEIPWDGIDRIRATLGQITSREITEAALKHLQTVLFECLELTKGWSDEVDVRVAHAVESVRENSSHPWTVTGLARASRLSVRHFRQLFAVQMGLSPRKYIQWVRVRTAAIELTRHKDISRAAINAGFADAAHFTRCFRAMTGITPSMIVPALNRISFDSLMRTKVG